MLTWWFSVTQLTLILIPHWTLPTVLLPICPRILLILEAHEGYLMPLKGLTAVHITFHTIICISVHDLHAEKSLNTIKCIYFLCYYSLCFWHDQWILQSLRIVAYLLHFLSQAKQYWRWTAPFVLKQSYEGSKRESQRSLLFSFLLLLLHCL